jgi:uncharacterized protein YhfF
MSRDKSVATFWEEYCASLPKAQRDACLKVRYEAWPFGDSPEMADELGRLVLEGKKTATAGLLWDEEAADAGMPTEGAKAVIVDGRGRPQCVIEYTHVTVKPFRDVDYAFAELEGEGFRSIDDWRQAHWRFFTRRCIELKREPSDLMPVVCQTFRVLFRRSP